MSGKKKKVIHQKSRVKVGFEPTVFVVFKVLTKFQITGRKENVEEAKRRILAQVDRLVCLTSILLL